VARSANCPGQRGSRHQPRLWPRGHFNNRREHQVWAAVRNMNNINRQQESLNNGFGAEDADSPMSRHLLVT
jgi:hypothetical protein